MLSDLSPLPAGANVNNRFRLVFVPTYEWWVGMQANPWVILDSIAIDILQTIWDTIYVGVPYTVTAGSIVFDRVCPFLFFFHFYFSF